MRKYSGQYTQTAKNFANRRKNIENNAHFKTVSDEYDQYEYHQGSLKQYAKHLEQSNRLLHQELDKQRYTSQQEINRLKKKLQAKENLLSDCERQIRHIKAQYQVIDQALRDKEKALTPTDENKFVTPIHGLLKKGKKVDFYE